MDIHVYEYDSMPGVRNGYYEIYDGEFDRNNFIDSADNSNVFTYTKFIADLMRKNIVFHTLSKWEKDNV